MTCYEVVGVISADAADHLTLDGDTILIEHDDPAERLIAQPRGDSDGD